MNNALQDRFYDFNRQTDTGLKGLGKKDFNNAVNTVKAALDGRKNLLTYTNSVKTQYGQLPETLLLALKKSKQSEEDKENEAAANDPKFAELLKKRNSLRDAQPDLESEAKAFLAVLSQKTQEKVSGYAEFLNKK